jgi:hypothetical protein
MNSGTFPEKFVYCRPRGGLNDTLCQMEKCYRYAKQHHRQLFINTDRSGFRDDFSTYFQPVTPTVTLGSHEKFKNHIDSQSNSDTYIKILPDVHLDYQSICENFRWIDCKTGKALTFDFSKKYEESILVYEQHGGGTGINFLEQLQLQPAVSSIIRQHIQKLGHYDAVHIRNTDYQTDYQHLLEQIIPKAKRPVVICTDDSNVQTYAAQRYGEKIRFTHALPNISHLNVHTLHDNPELNRYDINLGALIDLFVLASARKLYITRLRDGQEAEISGFLILALSLKKRKNILIRLLSGKNLTTREKITVRAYSTMQFIHAEIKALRTATKSIRRVFRPKPSKKPKLTNCRWDAMKGPST